MFSKLLLAFPAFVVAAAGVGAAELYLASDNGLVIAGCLVVGLFILGYAADYTAREILLPDHPVAAGWPLM